MIERPSPPPISTDVVIIGAGVAGIFAAKELVKENIDFWLLGSPYESQLAKAGELEETSLPDGTVGLKYIEQEIEELKRQNINHRTSSCRSIEEIETGYLVKTKFQDFETKLILIATGNKQKSLDFVGEDKFFRKGISDCTVCDYPLYRDKKVAVLGNHKYTIRAAELMRKHTDSVSLLWYDSSNSPNIDGIDIYQNVTNLKAMGDETLEKITFNCETGEKELIIEGLFVEGEPVPVLDFLGQIKIKLDDGHIHVDENYQTSIPSIWAAGDIIGGPKTYDKSAKDGKKAAQSLIEHIQH